MKSSHKIWKVLIPALFCIQLSFGQVNPESHSFTIEGEKKFFDSNNPGFYRTVDYDSTSANHLIISIFRPDGYLLSRITCRYYGKNFELSKLASYMELNELVPDGLMQTYTGYDVLETEQKYEEGKVKETIVYYKTGGKHFLFTGSETNKNGLFMTWNKEGSQSVVGNYVENLKDGLFKQFDASGNLIGEGTYKQGKLVSGVPVVPDIFYSSPDVAVNYQGGDSAFIEVLRQKTSGNPVFANCKNDGFGFANVNLTIDRNGNVTKASANSDLYSNEILNEIAKIFEYFPGFVPAKVEQIAVESSFSIGVVEIENGLTAVEPVFDICPEIDEVLVQAETMPEYPGGEKALLSFIAKNVRYPIEAQEKGIDGKVLVRFIIDKTGSIRNVVVYKPVHPLLNEEAIRVVKTISKWKPATINGKPVNVHYTMPVNFVLRQSRSFR